MSTPSPEPRYGALVLAAGRSTRFAGGHKLIADVAGKPLIHHALAAVAAAPLAEIVLVVSDDTRALVLPAVGEGRWRVALNPIPEAGLSSSLKAGLPHLPPGLSGVLVALGDMPAITADLIGRVLAKATEYPGAIVYPETSEGRQGHPVLWPMDIAAEFTELTGDQGGKPLLRRHAHRIVTIASAPQAAMDIDTREDLAAYVAGQSTAQIRRK